VGDGAAPSSSRSRQRRLLVDAQSLGDVALSLESLHEQRVAALPVGSEIDQAPRRALRHGDLGSTDGEAPSRRAFQRPDPDVVQLASALVDPVASSNCCK